MCLYTMAQNYVDLHEKVYVFSWILSFLVIDKDQIFGTTYFRENLTTRYVSLLPPQAFSIDI